jgi:hypothetical protein
MSKQKKYHARHASPRIPLRDRVRSLVHYPVLVLFSLFFMGLFVLDIATPDRARSELENTTLTQRPTLALNSLSATTLNRYFSNYTQYVKDQVFARDAWISLQSFCETTLLQKTENGGILIGKESMQFPRTYSLLSSETRNLPKNIAALQSLVTRYPNKVNALIVPSASSIYPENVPLSAPLLDEDSYIDEIAAAVTEAGGTFVDVRDTLTAHKSEYIYYRTDHHWTTTGAYYAYEQLCGTLGLSPFDRTSAEAKSVDRFYGTHYSKSRLWNTVPDIITYYDLPNTLTVYTVSGADQFTPTSVTGLYDTEKFDVYDKYAAFIYGNNGYSRIDGDGTGSILVIKDSYANSFVPYLTANYKNIDIIDFRNFNYGLDALIAANNYDQILVLYSFDSFKSDMYLYRAGIAG